MAVFVPATGVAPALHAYVIPVAGVAVNVLVVFVQVITVDVKPALGGVVVLVTLTDAVAVQPFVVLVTVTV